MKRQVEDWLDLSLNHSLPPSLLILSRALAYTSTSSRFSEKMVLEDMKSTLSGLPGVVRAQQDIYMNLVINSSRSGRRLCRVALPTVQRQHALSREGFL